MPNLVKKNWSIIASFGDQPINAMAVRLVGSPNPLPDTLPPLIKTSWEIQLLTKQAQLAQEKFYTYLAPYNPIGGEYNALFSATGQPVMWPGPTISLLNFTINLDSYGGQSTLLLNVYSTCYPYIAAAHDPQVIQDCVRQGTPFPTPPLGICTFTRTSDGFLTLTIRTSQTDVYPNRKYGQGGNPQAPDIDLTRLQMYKINEEIMVEHHELNLQTGLQILGLVRDDENFPNKPDLISFIDTSLTSETITQRLATRTTHPTDALQVEFVPTDPDKLLKYLATNSCFDFCPPAYAGLVLYGQTQYGFDWFAQLHKNTRQGTGNK